MRVDRSKHSVGRRNQSGILLGALAVLILPLLILFIGLGIDAVRAKYARAELDSLANQICAAVAQEIPFHRAAISAFHQQIKAAIDDDKARYATILGATLYFPTQEPSANSGPSWREPFQGWRKPDRDNNKECSPDGLNGMRPLCQDTPCPLQQDGSIFFSAFNRDFGCDFAAEGAEQDCKFAWDICSGGSGPESLWSAVEDAGSAVACELRGGSPAIVSKLIPNLADVIGVGEDFAAPIVSRVVFAATPLLEPTFKAKEPVSFFERRNDLGEIVKSANIPYRPISIAVAPELTTHLYDERFSFPSEPPRDDFQNYAEFISSYDPIKSNINEAFGKQPGPCRGLELLCTEQQCFSQPPQPAPRPARLDGDTPKLSPPDDLGIPDKYNFPPGFLGRTCRDSYSQAPFRVIRTSQSTTPGLWASAVRSCINPLILARNVLSASLLHTLGRTGSYRYTTEFLTTNPAPYHLDPQVYNQPSPPVSVVEFGLDPLARQFEVPYVYFRNTSIFRTNPAGDQLNPGWPYPWSQSKQDRYIEPVYQSVVVSQLRACFHLYQDDWSDDAGSPSNRSIEHYLKRLWTGPSAFLNNNGFEDPNWVKAGALSNQSGSEDPWQQMYPWGPDGNELYSVTAGGKLTAPEVATILGSVQYCPMDWFPMIKGGDQKWLYCRQGYAPTLHSSEGAQIPPEEQYSLRPDFEGLFNYWFPRAIQTPANGINSPLEPAFLETQYSYQSPGLWWAPIPKTELAYNGPSSGSYRDTGGRRFILDPLRLNWRWNGQQHVEQSNNWLMRDLRNKDSFSDLLPDGRIDPTLRLFKRRAANILSTLVIITHKGPKNGGEQDEAKTIANLMTDSDETLGCSRRPVLIIYLPDGPEKDVEGYESWLQALGYTGDGINGWNARDCSESKMGYPRDRMQQLRQVIWLSPKNPSFGELYNPGGGALEYRKLWMDMLNDGATGDRAQIFAGTMALNIARRRLMTIGQRY